MQGGIKYHFLSLWYDSTWDWTPISKMIGEHSNYKANGQNIEKILEDLRKLAVTQTPLKNSQLILWKTPKAVNNNNNNNNNNDDYYYY